MIAPAPREPSANQLDRRYIHYLAGNEAALERSIARYVRVKRRERDRADDAQARADATPLDAMTALGDALGLRLRRVGEVADPPPARPVTRRKRRRP